jgi:5-methyltetrahydrofolate--homocysteine methyltransferase
MTQWMDEIFQDILEGNAKEAKAKVEAALAANLDPADILNQGMVSAMAEVGRRFERGDYFVPEMLISARAMKEGLAILKPHLVKANIKPLGRVVIGTVRGDQHDIGKNLVSMMLEGTGFEVQDLGTDVAAEKFVEAARVGRADIVGLSSLLTTTMVNMKTVIQAFEEAGMRSKIKIMVGGAPVTETFAREIGADGYASDASRAAVLARSLLV